MVVLVQCHLIQRCVNAARVVEKNHFPDKQLCPMMKITFFSIYLSKSIKWAMLIVFGLPKRWRNDWESKENREIMGTSPLLFWSTRALFEASVAGRPTTETSRHWPTTVAVYVLTDDVLENKNGPTFIANLPANIVHNCCFFSVFVNVGCGSRNSGK